MTAMLLNLLCAGILIACQVAPNESANPAEPTPAATTSIDSAEALLEALERSESDLRDLRGLVRYTTEQGLLGNVQVRTGDLFYRVDPAGETRQFAIHFKELRVDEKIESSSKDYVFDGRWLVERLNDEKQFFKREVVAPGDSFDALSLDGPFPLPIGQRKDEILKRFDARLLPPESSGRLAGHHHLELTPRDVTNELEDLEQVDLWYDSTTLLPLRAVVVEKSGDISTVDLADLRRDTGVDQSMFATESPDVGSGWRIEVTRLKRDGERTP
ncbi:MAG: outer membrane lipoprotein carrier protein LolA [Phycisphaerales bacterium]